MMVNAPNSGKKRDKYSLWRGRTSRIPKNMVFRKLITDRPPKLCSSAWPGNHAAADSPPVGGAKDGNGHELSAKPRVKKPLGTGLGTISYPRVHVHITKNIHGYFWNG
jgi:hypothetical protein